MREMAAWRCVTCGECGTTGRSALTHALVYPDHKPLPVPEAANSLAIRESGRGRYRAAIRPRSLAPSHGVRCGRVHALVGPGVASEPRFDAGPRIPLPSLPPIGVLLVDTDKSRQLCNAPAPSPEVSE